MTIEVRFFAELREALGRDRETMEIDAGRTARDVAASVTARLASDRLRELPLLYAVNERVVSGDTPLRDGDRLALLPPLAGG